MTAGGPTTQSVVLDRLPVRLFRAFEEQADALLREYVLRSLGAALSPYPPDEVARAGQARAMLSMAVDQAASVTGGQPAQDNIDVLLDLASLPVGDFSVLQGVLDDAVRLARSGELLVLPSLPEIVALGNWLCEQITSQASGALPVPWRLPIAEDQPPATPFAEWDGLSDLPSDAAWVVGDDHNRIIAASGPVLALLGWAEPDLVGQRIIAVIPPRLRESHIAGFTRSVVSGSDAVLGRPLALAAWHRDGRELPVTLTLTRHAARKGRSVYLARIDPA